MSEDIFGCYTGKRRGLLASGLLLGTCSAQDGPSPESDLVPDASSASTGKHNSKPKRPTLFPKCCPRKHVYGPNMDLAQESFGSQCGHRPPADLNHWGNSALPVLAEAQGRQPGVVGGI